ncbi:MAG: hypothetical protein L3J49_04240 [Desulfobulbaceae bacterium]|nr:hypothetical protein [Desulfobulbaceae bacterium]
MKKSLFPIVILRTLLPVLLILGPALPALAHRIQVLAYPSGGEIIVEATLGNEQPVTRGSEVTVTKSVNGDVLLRGETDMQGRFTFPIPELSPDTGLLISVNSGMGHLGSSTLTPEELVKLSETREAEESKASSLSPEEQRLSELISRAVAREVEPLKHMLAKKMDSGPSMRDIIGGIGWLVGIGGLLAALKKKR